MNKRVKEKGLTLTEVMVSVFIFSVIAVVLSGVLFSNLRLHRRTYAVQETLGEVDYALEYMSRLARMAKSDEFASCIENTGYTYQSKDNTLKFIDYLGRCVSFMVEDERIKVIRENENEDDFEAYLTSPSIDVFSLNFAVDPGLGDGNDFIQPSATISLSVRETTIGWFEVSAQTTVIRRSLALQ